MFARNSGALILVPALHSKTAPTPIKLELITSFFIIKFMNSSCLGNPRETQTISGFLLIKSSINSGFTNSS